MIRKKAANAAIADHVMSMVLGYPAGIFTAGVDITGRDHQAKRTLDPERESDWIGPFGTCPFCRKDVHDRMKQVNPVDLCESGHIYPSHLTTPPKVEANAPVQTEAEKKADFAEKLTRHQKKMMERQQGANP